MKLGKFKLETPDKLGEKLREILVDGSINRLSQLVEAGRMLNEAIDLAVGECLPFHKFNLGRSALKIKPGEGFGAIMRFPKPPKVSAPVKIIAALIGLLWTPL